MRLLYGTRVRVCDGSGLESGTVGTVVHPAKILTNGRGSPCIPGYYKPVDWSKEVAIETDEGRLLTMFKDRLLPA